MTKRRANDFYPTPYWITRRLIEAVDLPVEGKWLEPAAGDGHIVRMFEDRDIEWTLRDICARPGVEFADYLTTEFIGGPFDVLITNPPFNLAFEFAQKAITDAKLVVLLLPVTFLQSAGRADWLRKHTPDVYIIPERPSFTGSGNDQRGVAWMVWGQGGGKLSILPSTPAKERKAAGRASKQSQLTRL